MHRQPPRTTPTDTPFPYETLFRSQPYPIETMLRIHFMQQWFNLSDQAMEEALYDSFSMRQFAKLPGGRAPDETTILNFRHLLEKHNIAEEMFEGVNLDRKSVG